MREKRTSVDFSQHQITETITDEVKIWKFAKPNTNVYSMTFINCRGILAVTGDLGNWIFCREFHPSAKGYVSDSYWCEKAKIASSQKPYEFDSKATIKQIEEMIKEKDEYGYNEEDIEYLNRCKEYTEYSEWEYDSIAYGESPSNWDTENVPKCYEIKTWLQIIFDGFDEMCRRMAQDETKPT